MGAPAQVRVRGPRPEAGGGVRALEAATRRTGGRRRPAVPSGEIKVGRELPDPVLPVHFLQFHPPVLKPDFHLSVREVDAAADLQAPLAR